MNTPGLAASLLASACLMLTELRAQPHLALLRHDEVMYTLHPGDRIKFKSKTSNRPRSGTISGIYRDYITLANKDTVYISHIRKIDVSNLPAQGFHVKSAGTKLMLAGAILFIADRASQSNEGGDATGVTVASAALFGTGLLIWIVYNDYFRVGRKKRVVARGLRWSL